VSDTPHVPACDEVAWLRARVAELEERNARLREAAAARDELAAAQLAARDAQIAALAAQVEELLRRLDKDSSTSSKPPSSDSPYKKKPRHRSLRGRSGRRPGKQPGAQSSTLKQSPDPDDTVLCGPAACGCCGHDLTGEPVLGTPQKRQVFEASPLPPPTVTEYQVAAKQCPECGEISVGLAPAGVTGRVQYEPGVHAKAALAVCAHYLPVARAARLVAALTGVNVSARSMAGLLIDANAAATAARTAGQGSLSDAGLARIRSWYRGTVAKGIADNQHKRTQIGKDGLRLARRFRDHEDMILRLRACWAPSSEV
jgi:transposase